MAHNKKILFLQIKRKSKKLNNYCVTKTFLFFSKKKKYKN